MSVEVKQEVRQFYDQVGWQLVDETFYQNAHFEDLRPVSRDYIHECHLRVARHLKPNGRFLLDAGSGPIQYPEYLEFSKHYQRRVCGDISITALIEARKRIGDHGLFVVCDIANLPFRSEVFDGVVTLHTIHHLPEDEHLQAYQECFRVLAPESTSTIVNGWPVSSLMNSFDPLIRLANRLRNRLDHRDNSGKSAVQKNGKKTRTAAHDDDQTEATAVGTFTSRHDVSWVKQEIGRRMPVEILVWRSVSVRFMRALIHPRLGGRLWLKCIYWMEERFPHFFGENGQYPLIVIHKP